MRVTNKLAMPATRITIPMFLKYVKIIIRYLPSLITTHHTTGGSVSWRTMMKPMQMRMMERLVNTIRQHTPWTVVETVNRIISRNRIVYLGVGTEWVGSWHGLHRQTRLHGVLGLDRAESTGCCHVGPTAPHTLTTETSTLLWPEINEQLIFAGNCIHFTLEIFVALASKVSIIVDLTWEQCWACIPLQWWRVAWRESGACLAEQSPLVHHVCCRPRLQQVSPPRTWTWSPGHRSINTGISITSNDHT